MGAERSKWSIASDDERDSDIQPDATTDHEYDINGGIESVTIGLTLNCGDYNSIRADRKWKYTTPVTDIEDSITMDRLLNDLFDELAAKRSDLFNATTIKSTLPTKEIETSSRTGWKGSATGNAAGILAAGNPAPVRTDGWMEAPGKSFKPGQAAKPVRFLPISVYSVDQLKEDVGRVLIEKYRLDPDAFEVKDKRYFAEKGEEISSIAEVKFVEAAIAALKDPSIIMTNSGAVKAAFRVTFNSDKSIYLTWGTGMETSYKAGAFDLFLVS